LDGQTAPAPGSEVGSDTDVSGASNALRRRHQRRWPEKEASVEESGKKRKRLSV